jgi:hypothetical protein
MDRLGEQLERQRRDQRAAGKGEQHTADSVRGLPVRADGAADDQRAGRKQTEH